MAQIPLKPPAEAINSKLRLFDIYNRTPYLSIKHDSYFQVYEEVLSRFVDREFTFVEVGVLNGGSLFMWREYFGPRARIIGIDLNPAARRWEQEGFEIFIGSQSDPRFWEAFYSSVGEIDVLVDDGGHTNRQQIVCFHEAVSHVRNGGVILVEDVHASYLSEFGNPSRHSFIRFVAHIVDRLNSRSSQLRVADDAYSEQIYSVSCYESIVVFHIDRQRCFIGRPTSNSGADSHQPDFRLRDLTPGAAALGRRLRRGLGELYNFWPARVLSGLAATAIRRVAVMIENERLRRFFH